MEIAPLKYDNLEEFKKRYILEKAQEYALKEGYSYYNIKTSNVDGTFIGEKFDNQIRLATLIKQNAEYATNELIAEMNVEALEKWKVDKQKSIEKYGN